MQEIDLFGTYAASGAGALVGAALLRRDLAPEPAAAEAIRDTRTAFLLLALGLLHPIFLPAPRPIWSVTVSCVGATGFAFALVWSTAQLVGRPLDRGSLLFTLGLLVALFMGLSPLGLDALADARTHMLLVGACVLVWMCRPMILAPRDIHERLYGGAVLAILPVHLIRSVYAVTLTTATPDHMLQVPVPLRTPMGLLYAVLPLLYTLLLFNVLHSRHQAHLLAGLTTDPLTGARNRYALAAGVESLRASAAAAGDGLAVILTDIDHFKRINDHHGHATGDEVLCQFVRRMTATLPDDATFVRLGGEEFVAVLPMRDPAAAVAMADRMREAACGAGGSLPAITASFGVAMLEDGQPIESALSLADAALYRAKHGGRDQVVAAAPRVPVRGPAGGRTPSVRGKHAVTPAVQRCW